MSDSLSSLLSQAREELRPVKEDFEAKNKQLLEEMPKFYSSRIDYFKPSFESLVRAQVRCCPLSPRPRGVSLWWHPRCRAECGTQVTLGNPLPKRRYLRRFDS